MKIRNDFVSNSSSSSFICAIEDASMIELFNESEIMNLHQYLEKFGRRDFFNDYWYDKDHRKNISFVDDKEFCDLFRCSIKCKLPISAKNDYLKIKIKYSKKKYKYEYEYEKAVWDAIMPYIEKALNPVWGNCKFAYYEAEDCSTYHKYDKDSKKRDNCRLNDWFYDNDDEESYLTSLFDDKRHSMTFIRIFSNH